MCRLTSERSDPHSFCALYLGPMHADGTQQRSTHRRSAAPPEVGRPWRVRAMHFCTWAHPLGSLKQISVPSRTLPRRRSRKHYLSTLVAHCQAGGTSTSTNEQRIYSTKRIRSGRFYTQQVQQGRRSLLWKAADLKEKESEERNGWTTCGGGRTKGTYPKRTRHKRTMYIFLRPAHMLILS